ncbi:MAG: hypothetical protein JWR63_1078 [Conexibacter sp.]|nr:hypothetical protein [Conexibacter sp.]
MTKREPKRRPVAAAPTARPKPARRAVDPVDRAAIVARYVQDRGGCSRDEVAAHVGVSRRTLSRTLPLAVERGWLATIRGAKGGIQPGPVAVPDETKAAA